MRADSWLQRAATIGFLLAGVWLLEGGLLLASYLIFDHHMSLKACVWVFVAGPPITFIFEALVEVLGADESSLSVQIALPGESAGWASVWRVARHVAIGTLLVAVGLFAVWLLA